MSKKSLVSPAPNPARMLLLRAELPAPDKAAGGELPTSFRLLKWGVNETTKGRVIVNEHTAAVLQANQAKIKRPTIQGDFEHESCRPDVKHPINYAAKNARLEVRPGDGLYAIDAEWTEAGKTNVPQNYGDLSAAVYLSAAGEVIGLHSFAVCAHGEVDGITISPLTLSAGDALYQPTHENPPPMTATALLAKLLTAMGIPTQESDSMETIAANVDKAMADEKSTDKGPGSGEADVIALSALSAKLDGLAAQVTTLSAAAATSEIGQLITLAASQGKEITLSVDDLKLLGPVRAKAYLDGLKSGVVPLSANTPAGTVPPASKPQQDPDFIQAFKDMGMEPPSAV